MLLRLRCLLLVLRVPKSGLLETEDTLLEFIEFYRSYAVNEALQKGKK